MTKLCALPSFSSILIWTKRLLDIHNENDITVIPNKQCDKNNIQDLIQQNTSPEGGLIK